MAIAVTDNGSDVLRPREYQLEMLRDSMQRNIIVAMDTGSGKTNIAIMRIAAELERCPPNKRVWFLCPKVALAQQQCRVISKQLPSFPTKILLGKDGCEFWSSQSFWDEVLLNIRIVVCTHEILSQALSHAFVGMADIALLVFDEAHHCKDNHAANRIMQHFYHPRRLESEEDVPYVLGLTASPIFNDRARGITGSPVLSDDNNEGHPLRVIERNLDAICRTPRLHREELLKYVHRPELILKTYKIGQSSGSSAFHRLDTMFHSIDMNEDPWIKYLLANPDQRPQQLEKAYMDRKTDCQEQLKTLVGTTRNIDVELGSWATEAYIRYCIDTFRQSKRDVMVHSSSLEEDEFAFMYKFLTGLGAALGSGSPDLQASSVTSKVNVLIDILLAEASSDFSGIVFVDQRAVVCMLKRLLEAHPSTKNRFRIGAIVGTSTNTQKKAKISDSVTRDLDNEELEDVLDDLRFRKKNLLISTTVLEEGIDITACNTVICFDQPKNLASFIQRRGRARSSQSKYYIVLAEHITSSATKKWIELEEKMKQMYMDDMRKLQRLEYLENCDKGHREFEVPSTGAKLTLQDALPHLQHFCNTLLRASYTCLDPIFICEGAAASESVSCKVILPNCVDSSVREFESSRLRSSERLAKMDAAFEAYVGLYHAGLVNDNLLPHTRIDEEEEKIYRKIEKRKGVVMANQVMDPWRSVAEAWTNTNHLQQTFITISSGTDTQVRMRMLLPMVLTHVESFKLYFDVDTEFEVNFSQPEAIEYDNERLYLVHRFTKTILFSAFRTKMSLARNGFPVLFAPTEELTSDSIEYMQGNWQAKEIRLQHQTAHSVGLIRESNGVPHFFHDLGTGPEMLPEMDGRPNAGLIQAFRCPKRIDYLHPIAVDANKKATVPTMLDLEQCTVDKLPISFARFALFVPSMMHKIHNALIVEDLCSNLLSSVGFSNKSLVLNAISAPVAREGIDYQRLEFLGDALLKYYTAVSLTAEHLNYPERYLSKLKERVVSNSALAIAATDKGLDKYILRHQFRGTKWRPLYNEDILAQNETKEEELATKILADVIESLVGAAYLDGGEPKLLACLQTLLSKKRWEALSCHHQTLLLATSAIPHPLPQTIIHLQSLTNHIFTHPSLALEALTHPSHFSPTKSSMSTSSYQRLEFLGDAVLDEIVTKKIFAHTPALPTPQMHLLRSAAVNADFLAYLALKHSISVPITNVVPPTIPASPLSSLRKRRQSPGGLDSPPPPETTAGTTEMNFLSLIRRAPAAKTSGALSATTQRFDILQLFIAKELESGDSYPWTYLVRLAAEKMISDVVESVLGAIYVDTAGDIQACERFLRVIGVLPWLERALKEGVKVFHPKEELGVMAGQSQKKVEYVIEVDEIHNWVETDDIENGRVLCRLKVGGEEIATARGISKFVAETRAAAVAVEKLSGNSRGTSNKTPHENHIDIRRDSPISPDRYGPINPDRDSPINLDRDSPIPLFSSDNVFENSPPQTALDLENHNSEDERLPYSYDDYDLPHTNNDFRSGKAAATWKTSAGGNEDVAIVIDDSDDNDDSGSIANGNLETSQYWSCAEEL